MNDALADYVRDLANLMHLRDWAIFVSDDPDDKLDDPVDDERCATFSGTLGRRTASIWINADYWTKATPEERRQTITHELIHIHAHPAREVIINALTIYPKRTAEVLLAIFDVQEEYMVDTLADVIALQMPLPPEDDREGV